MINYREICLKVVEIARQAGEYIARQREELKASDIEYKGDQNMVTYVDKNAEAMIVEKLSQLIYGAGYITEEGTATSCCEYLKWIIDPLDGTTNFIHGLPPYCVSIALMEGDEIVVGVVYEITLKEVFYAWSGSQAYLNGQLIKVSGVDDLKDSLIAVGFAYSVISKTEEHIDKMVYFQKHTNGIRRIGSAAVDLVYVACGRFDGFYHTELAVWDVAAGAFIAKAAGAEVTDYDGGNDYLFGRRIIACTPAIYDRMQEKVR